MIDYPQIDPIALDLGIIQIRWYGLTYLAGLGTAWWLLERRARQSVGVWTSQQVSDLVFNCAVGLIIGGRLGSVVFYNLPYYLSHPLDIFKIWQGGMSFHGGLLGVAVAIALFGRTYHKRFFTISDFMIPVVPIGLGFGRIGNFINAELWGAPSSVAWAMIFPGGGDLPRHPSQLYEAVLEGILLFIVLWWYSSRPRPMMAVSGLFLMLYGIFRFMVEFVREPDAHIGYLAGDWLTMGQVLSTPMILVGVILVYLAYTRATNNEQRATTA
jgi:phosphatidylglycerol---prolipoprotein diacylglyceryl transferase